MTVYVVIHADSGMRERTVIGVAATPAEAATIWGEHVHTHGLDTSKKFTDHQVEVEAWDVRYE